jgi:hypothetical protein
VWGDVLPSKSGCLHRDYKGFWDIKLSKLALNRPGSRGTLAENETHLTVEAELPNSVKERLVRLLDEEEYKASKAKLLGL